MMQYSLSPHFCNSAIAISLAGIVRSPSIKKSNSYFLMFKSLLNTRGIYLLLAPPLLKVSAACSNNSWASSEVRPKVGTVLLPARSGSTRASPGTEDYPSGLSARSTRNSATTASNSRRRAHFRSKPEDASRRATTPSRPTFRRSSSAACSSRCRSCRA